MEQVLLGYLRLLVNTRDELALARILNIPDRGLDHRAFTDVKHEARRRGLSMYQVAAMCTCTCSKCAHDNCCVNVCRLQPRTEDLSVSVVVS